MYLPILCVRWTVQPLSADEYLALRDAARRNLQEEEGKVVSNFTHEHIQGTLTRGKEGLLGTFGGTFFKANLGVTEGQEREVVFLLPEKNGKSAHKIQSKDVSVGITDEYVEVDTDDTDRTGVEWNNGIKKKDDDDDGFVVVD